mmetsp:Transcript_28205/g.58865  ORF Transcript_28205/g.58865 Transcript_28205/m.58865 type:complete len:252 (-) Transcript_28205:90-845(-)
MDSSQDAKFDSNRSRVVLSRTAAREIFIVKSNLGLESAHQASIRLAAKYRISSKAIRDIWKGRSWLDATFDLWSEEDRPCRRIVGRPKGKKDSKPRAKGRAGQDAHGNACQPLLMDACDYSDECRFQYAPQFDASKASDSCHLPLAFRFGEQFPSPMDSREAQTSCLLPSFGSFMQDMGLVPAIPDPFAHQATFLPASLRIQKDCGSLPTPSMFVADAQGSLLALMASHLLSSRSASAVSGAPFGAGLSFT